ncbi:ATP-grasp domain-containing protein [Bauldia sp.]|uniref:ATP-grasp domain-containing protein n=1 Tax=Bauldia sp. TaxID=2575872 RepID=UPI003BA8AD78
MKAKTNVLVTCGRFYPSIALVRALHDAGARVDVADSYKLAPALHSSAVDQFHVVAPAAGDPLQFVEDVAQIIKDRDIDLVVPAIEEGFYLRNYEDLIPAPIFAPSFATIEQLHDKARFHALCAELGLRTPKTITVTSQDELRDAIGQFDLYLARPAFSRGGQTCLTNHGPRAGEMSVDDCVPTTENPWLVQEFVEGDDACSFSVVRDGEVVVHCTYEPSVAATGGYAIQFHSIDDFGTLEVARAIAKRFDYTGFLGLDIRRTPDGAFVMIECNPRVTAGSFLTPGEWVGGAVIDEPSELRIAPAGQKRQYDAYMLVGNAAKLPARKLLHELLTTPDAVLKAGDVLPALYCLINRRHWSHKAEEEHTSLSEAFTADISWDGSPMPTMPEGRGA